MLARDRRITSGTHLRTVMRSGVRSGRRNVVLYGLRDQGSCAGFIVSKKVGNAVVRNRVKRRLRAIIAASWGQEHLPDGLNVVVRALPGAGEAEYGELEREVNSALRTLHKRLVGRESDQC